MPQVINDPTLDDLVGTISATFYIGCHGVPTLHKNSLRLYPKIMNAASFIINISTDSAVVRNHVHSHPPSQVY